MYFATIVASYGITEDATSVANNMYCINSNHDSSYFREEIEIRNFGVQDIRPEK